MRKVYHSKGNSVSLSIAVAISAGLTAVIFCVIPFSHIVNKPGHTLELRKTSAADLPPPAEEQTQAPPMEPDKKQDAPPEPQLADTVQQVPLSADLDVAMGSGGALAGFGEVRSLTAATVIKDETFDVSELDKKWEPVSQIEPVFPRDLHKAKIEGSVTLVFILTEEGRVEDARIENSSRPEFEKPALEAIRKWRFKPGIKNGQPVRSYIHLPMKFRITAR